MNRRVEKVFKALQKKGMTEAFIEYDNQEFIFPKITGDQKTFFQQPLFIILFVALLSGGSLLLSQTFLILISSIGYLINPLPLKETNMV